jgi:hypothetical protein
MFDLSTFQRQTVELINLSEKNDTEEWRPSFISPTFWAISACPAAGPFFHGISAFHGGVNNPLQVPVNFLKIFHCSRFLHCPTHHFLNFAGQIGVIQIFFDVADDSGGPRDFLTYVFQSFIGIHMRNPLKHRPLDPVGQR